MKRFLAMALSLVMLFTFVPFSASADEEAEGSDNPLIEKAVAVFPEYADKLLNTQSTSAASDPSDSVQAASEGERVLVVKKSRPISDSEVITYSEYSDGVVLLSNYDCTCDSTLVSSSSGSTYKKYTINIEAACVANGYYGYFYLNNVSYTLNTGLNNYDQITNAGTASKGTNCVGATRTDFTPKESLTGYATIIYRLGFRSGTQSTQFVTSDLTLSVGEDTAVLDHIAWD